MNKKFKVNFDVCSFCNHKCNFCSNNDERTIKSKVNIYDFEKTLDNLSNYIEIDSLSLSAKGEVLMNKDLSKIIELSKSKYYIPYVYFSTNGSLLTKERALEILAAGIDSIKFSINGFSKEEYYSIHLKDDFNLVLENVKELLKLKKELFPNLKIYISSVTNKKLSDIKILLKEKLRENSQYIDDFFKYDLQFTPKYIPQGSTIIDSKNCLISIFREIYIYSDCSLGFCCKDYFEETKFGSLLDNDFLELYNNERFKLLRTNFTNNIFEKDSLCYNCLLFEGLKKQ